MQLQLQPQCTVASLKRTLSARLRLAKDRMVLLHRNRQLRDGTLDSNNVRDGERLTLLPSVETGLQAIKPEQSVMQALESLTDAQVSVPRASAVTLSLISPPWWVKRHNAARDGV